MLKFFLWIVLISFVPNSTHAARLLEGPYQSLPSSWQNLEKFNTPQKSSFDDVQVFALCTGYISINGSVPNPDFVWLIKSPRGNYLVDTGLSDHVRSRGYFRGVSAGVFRKKFTIYNYPENHLTLQLKKLGVEPTSLNGILLSHAHFDHIGNIEELSQVPVLITAQEFAQVSGDAQLRGYMKGTKELLSNSPLDQISIQTFESHAVNAELTLLRTDLHTKGHQMVLLKTKNFSVLFTGDTSVPNLENGSPVRAFLGHFVDLSKTILLYNHDQALNISN